MQIRDRIKAHRRVRAGDLVPHEDNWRLHPAHQREALAALYRDVGFARSLLAYELPDGRLKLIDGHLRRDMHPDLEVQVEILDVDDAEAKKLLATLDPLAAMAEADRERLDALLREVQTGEEAVAGMLTRLAEGNGVIPSRPGGGPGSGDGTNDLNEIYQGMPEFTHADQRSKYAFTVHIDTDEDLADFERRVGQEVGTRKWMHHPKKENGETVYAGGEADEP